MPLVVGDGGGIFWVSGFGGGGLACEREGLGGIFGGHEDGEVVSRGGIGFVELDGFAKFLDGLVGLTLFGEKQAEIEVRGGLGGIGGDGATKGVLGFVEVAELAVDDGSVDEGRGDTGSEGCGAFVFRSGLLEFLATGVEVAVVHVLGEIVLARGE